MIVRAGCSLRAGVHDTFDGVFDPIDCLEHDVHTTQVVRVAGIRKKVVHHGKIVPVIDPTLGEDIVVQVVPVPGYFLLVPWDIARDSGMAFQLGNHFVGNCITSPLSIGAVSCFEIVHIR